jgi:hydrogenase/urease accessory protein HupE
MKPRLLVAITLLMAPVFAWAHIGMDAGMHHESSFLAGVIHLISSADILLIMVAVGLLGALAWRRQDDHPRDRQF